MVGGNGSLVDTDDTHDGDDTGAGVVADVFLCRRMVMTNATQDRRIKFLNCL